MDVTIDVQNRELRACTQITKARKKGFYFMQSILLQMTRSKRAARKEKKISNYFNAQENQIFYKNVPQIYFPTNFTNGTKK